MSGFIHEARNEAKPFLFVLAVVAAGDHRFVAGGCGGWRGGVRLPRGSDEQEVDEGAVGVHLCRRGALECLGVRSD